jgi:hypothetical protein
VAWKDGKAWIPACAGKSEKEKSRLQGDANKIPRLQAEGSSIHSCPSAPCVAREVFNEQDNHAQK